MNDDSSGKNNVNSRGKDSGKGSGKGNVKSNVKGNDEENPMNFESLKQTLKKHSRSVGLAIVGAISAAAIPVWQIYFVEQADVDIEVSAIQRVNSDHFRVPLATEELQLLKPYIPEELFFEFDSNGIRGDKIRYPTFNVRTLELAFDNAKQDLKNIAETKALLEQYIATIDAYLDPNDKTHLLTEFRIGEMKEWSLSHFIDDDEAHYYEKQVLTITRNYAQMDFHPKDGPALNVPALKFLLSDVKEDLTEVILSNDHRLEKLRDNIRSIEAQLSKIKHEQLALYSYFEVEVVATNNGRASISLRPVAMIRVRISDHNYVDVQLKMEDYQSQSELTPASTKLLHYRSEAVYHFPIEDQKLVNTFWGSTGRARLFNLDTKQKIYVSNEIAFADNGNQKLMFDRLKEAAVSL
jgi:hypothetical protein